MSIKQRFFLWLIFILLSSGLFYSQLQSGLTIDTNILKLLPQTQVDPFAEKAFTRFSDKNFKHIILVVQSSDAKSSLRAAKKLHHDLDQSSSIESFQSSLSDSEQEAIAKLYFEHRFHLLSPADYKLLGTQGSSDLLDTSLQLIYSPLSGQLVSLLPTDPYLLSYRYLQHTLTTASGNSQGRLDDGFISYQRHNQHFVLIDATLKSSPFDTNTQAAINPILTEFERSHPEVKLLKTGALFYAQHATASAKSEISTIGLGSLLGVIVLLITAFRSVLPLVLTLTSLACGILFAFAVVHFAFGSIHILTLVFGSSLVGVAVDYAFHYFASANQHQKPLNHILPAITMGLISSVIGYIALFSAPFPGLRQMALFCAAGLIGTFLTVVLCFDRIHSRAHTPLWLLTLFTRHQSLSQRWANVPLMLALLSLPIIAAVLLLNTTPDNDNIRQLQSAPPPLIQQEAQIKELVSAPATNQFFVIKGDSAPEVMQQLEALTPKLKQLVSDSTISDYNHLAQFVPSRQSQTANYQLLQEVLTPQDLAQLVDLGLLSQQQVANFYQTFEQHQDRHLMLQDWLESPLGKRFDYLWLGTIDDQVAAIITLSNIQHIAPLETLAQQHSSLYFINKVDRISSLFAHYRVLALTMLLVAIAIIGILLALKYGSIIAGLVILGPVAASSLAIIVNIIINGSFNLFSTLALFLVFGIGIDYGIFYAEARSRSRYINLAIGLSALTTFLSFGLLSLSDTPAIHTFGLTMFTGILTVFLLSPILGHQIYQTKGLDHG